ncbi:uncharacterized protein V6R79_006250 [Siganus canaliculatus]
MATTQDAEIQFAQKLASNEKQVRTRAMKKLRKYINVRSVKDTGGFSGEDLLKLWKGLFYCLWMQDKPLLQEELSNHISSLVHSFHSTDGQLLFLESFLQTFKREWTGIDRLRMDKFYQLIRFMFRQTFETLKRHNWDSSLVSRFLDLLMTQVLHSDSGAPAGLQFHILDLYMTELAAVGSAELSADQNLVFIEPFCRTAARTKDRTLFASICRSIFSSIIDQAPFAISDLLKELKETSDSDSGQASDDDAQDHAQDDLEPETGPGELNGEEEDDEDDELLHLEELDTDEQGGDDVGPILQIDYSGLADKLLDLAAQSDAPSYNRKRLYHIIKVLRDLSEGIFPQNEYPEEVSTDEDDDSFGSRKRMKRRGHPVDEDEPPVNKKRKGKTNQASTINQQDSKDQSPPADATSGEKKKKKRRRRKKKKNQSLQAEGESEVSSVKVTEEQVEAPLLSEVKQLTATETHVDQSQQSSEEKQEVQPSEDSPEEETLDQTVDQTVVQEENPGTESSGAAVKKNKRRRKTVNADESEVPAIKSGPPSEPITPGSKKRKNKKGLKGEEEEKPSIAGEEASEDAVSLVPLKKKKKSKQAPAEGEETLLQKSPTEDGRESADEPVVTMTTPTKKKPRVEDMEDQEVSSKKPTKKKKKKKIPVVFEFEADELQAAASANGLPEDETSTVKNPDHDTAEQSSPLSAKMKVPSGPASDFITFQSKAAVPAPLYCKARGRCNTPVSSRKKSQTPRSDCKKVTFGLKNNKTAEFRKTDRSLLLSPVGSSRVPFDPEQKPKFGVLKTPPTRLSTKVKKTPANSVKMTLKRRPSAADFF